MDQTQIGIISGIIGFLAFLPYIVSTFQGKTRPNKATWIIWSILGVIIAASYYAAGARETAMLPFAYALGMILTTAICLRYREEGWTALDKGCLAGAGAGLILWALTKDAAMALYLLTIVDAIGSIPTIEKAWKRPETEDKAAWAMFLIANALNILAINSWTFSVAMYPIYVIILSGTMCALLFFPRKAGKISDASRKPPQRRG
jgi:hypothetical protein